jgi:dimethylhistidine N-methyltransferase
MTSVRPAADRKALRLFDHEPRPEDIREHVLGALSGDQREFSPKYFYDDAGAALFDRICDLDEYYLTRTESAIHDRHIREIAALIGRNARIVEFGSGSGRKSMRILSACERPSAYVPVDISRSQLISLALDVSTEIPAIEVLPVCADFSSSFELPWPTGNVERTVAFYHGSTIGNFHTADAERFLRLLGGLCGSGGGLLIGVDLLKDRRVIERAYNDAAGVTAEFNINLLRRINRECGADFDLSGFAHCAFYDDELERVEMRLVSTRPQAVVVPATGGARRFLFRRGDYLTTEYSYKYRVGAFEDLACRAGWKSAALWLDDKRWFGVWLLRRD